MKKKSIFKNGRTQERAVRTFLLICCDLIRKEVITTLCEQHGRAAISDTVIPMPSNLKNLLSESATDVLLF